MDRKSSIYTLTTVALLTAVMCVLAPLSVPIGPVPISLATLVVYLSTYIFGAWKSTAAVFLYIIIGMAGVPVLSGYTAGVAKLAGPTGGYLVGYLFIALVGGLIIDKVKRNYLIGIIAFIVSTALLYALGTAWFIVLMGGTVGHALTLCVYPFIPLDIVKIVVAVFFGELVRKRLVKAGIVM